jgi:hypothetical protein
MSTLLEHFPALDCTFPQSSALFESSLNFLLQLQLILNNRLHYVGIVIYVNRFEV